MICLCETNRIMSTNIFQVNCFSPVNNLEIVDMLLKENKNKKRCHSVFINNDKKSREFLSIYKQLKISSFFHPFLYDYLIGGGQSIKQLNL